jgi:hypothetical protein
MVAPSSERGFDAARALTHVLLRAEAGCGKTRSRQ